MADVNNDNHNINDDNDGDDDGNDDEVCAEWLHGWWCLQQHWWCRWLQWWSVDDGSLYLSSGIRQVAVSCRN